MQEAIILDTKDVKKIIAQHYNASEDDIICTKYSYVVKVVEKNDDKIE